MDKQTLIILDAIKRAIAEPLEQRLFRSGKLPGLFKTKTGSNARAANRAISEGLLEIVRTEPKGSTQTDWVRPTPKAVEFIHTHESPTAAMKELQALLKTTEQGVPVWVAEMQQQIQSLSNQLAAKVERIAHQMQSLQQRVDEAITRAEAAQPQLTDQLIDQVPWAGEALRYLDRRTESGGESPCPLSELFTALRENHPALTVSVYHLGLRRLFDRNIIRLLPYQDTNGLPEPEYALLDGFNTFYYVARAGK